MNLIARFENILPKLNLFLVIKGLPPIIVIMYSFFFFAGIDQFFPYKNSHTISEYWGMKTSVPSNDFTFKGKTNGFGTFNILFLSFGFPKKFHGSNKKFSSVFES